MGADLSFPHVKLPEGYTAAVTGGNTGLGYETAKHLAMMGGHVIICCRSVTRGEDAIQRMQEEYRQHLEAGTVYLSDLEELNVEVMTLDLSSIASTMTFIRDFTQRSLPLHTFVCNAGIAFIPHTLTDDGMEKQFQSGDDCRVVYVSSVGHTFGQLDLNNIHGEKKYRRSSFYGNSKLFQIMQAYTLPRKFPAANITYCSVHPGVVQTEIGRNYEDSRLWGTWWKLVSKTGYWRKTIDGAATIIKCCVDPALKGAAPAYYVDCKKSQPKRTAKRIVQQETLWAYTIDCLRSRSLVDEDVLAPFSDKVDLDLPLGE